MNLANRRTILHGLIPVRITAHGSKEFIPYKGYGAILTGIYSFTTANLIKMLQKHTWELSPDTGTQYTIHCLNYSLQIRIPQIYLSNLPPHIGLACLRLS